MKHITFILLVTVFATSCTSTKNVVNNTKVTESIKLDFNNYLKFIEKKDFENAIEYMLPDFFELVPKEQLIAVMEETFNNPEMIFEFKESNILSVGEVKKVEEKFYSNLRYSSMMSIKLNLKEEQDAESKMLLLNLYKASFGEENVSYNEKSDEFEVYAEKDAVAVSENGTSSWKFLVIEEKQRAILESFIPKEVLDNTSNE